MVGDATVKVAPFESVVAQFPPKLACTAQVTEPCGTAEVNVVDVVEPTWNGVPPFTVAKTLYSVAPLTAVHWNVTGEVTPVAPSAGERVVGAPGLDGQRDVAFTLNPARDEVSE